METLIQIAAVVTLVAVERVPALRFERLRFFRPFVATDVVYLVTGGIGLGFVLRAQASHWSALGRPTVQSSPIPFPLLVVLATVLYDLGNYISHVLCHRIDALWMLHKVHHSSRRLDWLATFRGHILEHTLRHLASAVLLILLGFPIAAVGIAGAIYAAWAAFGHANVRLNLRFLEPVLITPRLHRLHHVADTGERNLGTIFSLWDRLRGNLISDAAARLEPIGVPNEIETYPQSWLPQLVEPLRRGRGNEGASIDPKLRESSPLPGKFGTDSGIENRQDARHDEPRGLRKPQLETDRHPAGGVCGVEGEQLLVAHGTD